MKNSRSRPVARTFPLVIAAVWAMAHPARALDPEERPLPGAIAEIVKSTPLSRSRTSVMVQDLDSGETVYAYNPDELLNPASNMKVLTTVVALARLGPEYRFRTEVLLDEKRLDGGVLAGDLHLRGRGDPSLDTERVYRLVRNLRHAGLTEVRGDIVVDDTYFDDVWDGPGWEQDDSDSAYMAPAGAMSINFNAVAVHVWPGASVGAKARVELEPPSDYFVVENESETAPPGARRRIRVASVPAGDRQRIVVRARMPLGRDGEVFYRRISHPSLYAGSTMKAMLQAQGIKVRGKVRRGAAPERLRPFQADWSEPLSVILHTVNKWSQNHMTEMLLKTLGAEVKGEPGSWPGGVAVVEDFLADEVGIPRGSFVMKNGSGLNDTNRVSTRQIASVLRWAWRQELLRPDFLASLPIAGVDGTTRHRMTGTPAQGRVRAKTGTLSNVTALSGYATAVGGERYVFSILVNDYPGRLSRVLPGVDAIGEAIASVGTSGGPQEAVASAQEPPDDTSTPELELRARLVTFLHLAGAGDPRNAAFLRTALRNERDPALRAVIAEALYRSDPDDTSAERAVVESFSPSADVFGRLHGASVALGITPPVVNTLLDLAANGNEDAVGSLVAIASSARGDDRLEQLMATGLLEVSRTAPEELLGALKTADDTQQGAVAALIARGVPLADAGEPPSKHPFQDVLAGAVDGPDPKLASFARGMESRIERSLLELSSATRAGEPEPPAPADAPAPGGG